MQTVSTQTSDPAACCISPFDSVPWFRLSLGILIAAQGMSLGMAINVSPPDDATTRLLFHYGMAAGAGLMLILLGWPLLIESLRELRSRRITMELLFLAGIIASMGISVQSMIRHSGPIYFDVVSLLLVVYSVGKSIGGNSRSKALSAMRSLSQPIRQARVGGQMVDIAKIRIGDRVTVMPGEIIPVDGQVIRGTSFVRTTPFTGQSTSIVMNVGDDALAGSACEDGTLVIEATTSGDDRRIDRLAALIDSARCLPSALQRQADRLVRWFLPVVMLVAVGTYAYWSRVGDDGVALMHALAVLLIACPCAAGLATPLSLWLAIGRLSDRGLIVQGGDTIERLSQVRSVVFDKTGTLCAEELELDRLEVVHEAVAEIVATVERNSRHPVARALSRIEKDRLFVTQSLAHGRDARVTANRLPAVLQRDRGVSPVIAPVVTVKAIRILPARGIEADVVVDDAPQVVTLERSTDQIGFQIEIRIDDHLSGIATLRERLRDSSNEAIEQLQARGLDVRVMTGDASSTIGVPAQVKLTPDEKHALVSRSPLTLFVGDGVNDAAAMAAAHASIALAGGADITVQSAHATLHGGDLTLVPFAIDVSQRAVRMVRSNLRLAVAYNVVGIVLAATGLLHPILAAVLMAVSSAVVSWRAFRFEDAPAAPALTVPKEGRRRRRSYGVIMHSAGLVGQLIILALIGSLSAGATMLLVVVGILGAVAIARFSRRLPEWSDHLLAMFTLGGLGMNFGWWADLNFASAIQGSIAHACCSPEGKLAIFSWMNVGMLALGTPAMYLMRRSKVSFSLKNWCCVGPLMVGVPAMVGGMMLGSLGSARLEIADPQVRIGVGYLLMMVGMMLGMFVLHAIELPFKSLEPTPPTLSPES